MTNAENERDPLEEYEEVDPETITEDAIEYFDEPPGPADSPVSDSDAPAPG